MAIAAVRDSLGSNRFPSLAGEVFFCGDSFSSFFFDAFFFDDDEALFPLFPPMS